MLLFLPLRGQTPDTAGLNGRVLDQINQSLSGATVVLNRSDTGLRRTSRTDSRGNFSIGDLPIGGPYSILVSQTGFTPETRDDLHLRAGETAYLSVTLQAAGTRGQVTVFGTASGVQSDSPDLGVSLSTAKIEYTPIFGRKLTSLPLLDSAVRPARGTGDLFLNSTLFVVNGAGRRQTSYLVDGSTGDDAWGRQTIFATLPLSSIQELTLLTNSFSSEFGRTGGGVVNVNTKSGTNQIHGDLIGFWRPPSLQARAPLADRSAQDELKQFSGDVSGPIIANRAFFLFSGEVNRQKHDSTVNSPLAAGVFQGRFSQELGLIRGDARLSEHNSFTGKVQADRFSDTNPADAVGGLTLPSAARTFRRGAYLAQLGETSILSASALNEARAQFQIGSPVTRFDPVSPSTQYVRPGAGTEGESRYANLQNHQWQLGDIVSLARGNHNLRFGGDWIHSTSGGVGQEFGGGFTLGQFTLLPGDRTPVAMLTTADVQRYSQSFGNLSYAVHEWLGSVFLQDNWRLLPSFTLNAGLRYDRQSLTDDRRQWSPRVGFAWNPRQDRRTAIRGGFGIYYGQIRANIAAGYTMGGPLGLVSFTAAPNQFGFPTNLQPLASFPPGAVLPARDITVRPGDQAFLSRFFDVSKLPFFPAELLNPRTMQSTLGIEREIIPGWVLAVDAVHSRTTRIDRPLDLNAPALFIRTASGQTRSAAAADATRPLTPMPNGYRRILTTVNDGIAQYDGLQTNLTHRFSHHFSALASYTYSHAINSVEPDIPAQDPSDAHLLGRSERATSLLDQRHRAALSGWWNLGRGWIAGTSTFLASGRPFNVTTGVDNNGDGSNADRPVINGVVIGRNTGRGTPQYDAQFFGQYEWNVLAERVHVALRGESFNTLNHANLVGRNAVYGNGSTPLASFGQPLGGISNVEPGREFQFLLRVRF